MDNVFANKGTVNITQFNSNVKVKKNILFIYIYIFKYIIYNKFIIKKKQNAQKDAYPVYLLITVWNAKIYVSWIAVINVNVSKIISRIQIQINVKNS